MVGRFLVKLGGGWIVLHSVPVGERDADIDHVLIGRADVVTINTKHHAGQRLWVAGRTFMVAGHKQPYIPKAALEAKRAARLLQLADSGGVSGVRAVLVVVGAKQLTVKQNPSDVAVLQHHQLLRWLKRLPVSLSQEECDRLARRAELPATGRKAPSSEPLDAAELEAAFAEVRGEVRGRAASGWHGRPVRTVPSL